MSEREDLYRKIRGLLRKAEATNYSVEANLFLKKAQELMYTHAVDEEILWASEPDRRPKPVMEELKVAPTGAYFQRVILSSCARYNRCKMWYNGNTCTLCGFDSDVTYVMMLHASIMSQMNMQIAIGLARTEEHPKTFKVNFMQGFSYEIYDRLRNMNKEIHTAAHREHSRALVLSRDFQIEKFMEEQGIRLANAKSPNLNFKVSEAAHKAGKKAGKEADISGGRGRIQNRRAISG